MTTMAGTGQLPLFTYGFRTFFVAAGLSALILIPLWAIGFGFQWPLNTDWPPAAWHGHEMLFGFVCAAIAGFLLTAVPSWTGQKGFGGAPLMLMAAVWLLGRLLVGSSAVWPFVAVAVADLAFLAVLALFLAPPLLRERNRNTPLLAVLLLLWLCNAGFHLGLWRGDALLSLYLAIGIMIPIRLGTVSILRLVVALHLVNTLVALILVYTAMGLPLAIFILTQFMRQVPMELKDAARIDGASEYRIFRIVLPLVSPAVATVAVFTIVPIWNDLWFPLILAPGDSTKTVTLGAQQFLGQFVSDWNAVLSSLTLAMLPVLIIFILFSRQLIKGLTAGAIK